jgi:hypothetical protein
MGKPPLSVVVHGSTGTEPPRHLGPAGRQLWDGIMHEYDIRDRGGIELLCLAAEAIDQDRSGGAVGRSGFSGDRD